jgi:hypothetical protein
VPEEHVVGSAGVSTRPAWKAGARPCRSADARQLYSTHSLSRACTADDGDASVRLGEEINALGPQGQNALHFAAKQGHEKIIRLIVSAKFDVEAESSDGERPLSIAAQFGALDSVRVLVELGADVEVGQAGKLNHRPLHEAAKQGHETVAKALLELGAACARSLRWSKTLVRRSTTAESQAGMRVATCLQAGPSCAAARTLPTRTRNPSARRPPPRVQTTSTTRSVGAARAVASLSSTGGEVVARVPVHKLRIPQLRSDDFR